MKIEDRDGKRFLKLDYRERGALLTAEKWLHMLAMRVPSQTADIAARALHDANQVFGVYDNAIEREGVEVKAEPQLPPGGASNDG